MTRDVVQQDLWLINNITKGGVIIALCSHGASGCSHAHVGSKETGYEYEYTHIMTAQCIIHSTYIQDIASLLLSFTLLQWDD